MLDISFIRENPEIVKQNSKDRQVEVDIDLLLKTDEAYRAAQTEIQELRARRNKASKSKPTPEEIEAMRSLGDEVARKEEALHTLESELKEFLSAVPNLTHPEVKRSDNEDDNPVLETVEPPKFDFTPKDHVELCEALDLLDMERGAKVAGTKFYFLKNELAVLAMALNRYALDVAMRHGFIPMVTPDLARTEIIEGLGFKARGESSQIYNVEGHNLSLIGTAEITLGGYHADELLDLSAPKKYVGLSHCFRTEAGAASKFAKGIFRVHQFEKLEMFVYCRPEEAEEMHQELLAIQKEIFNGLEIPFRVVDHCTADLGTPAYRTFDLEAWLPGKAALDGSNGDWAEITSTSNCTDYQSRSLRIKCVDNGEKKLAYTLNGTANPGPRTLIALLENHQQADGSISIPKALHAYLPFKEIKKAER